MPVEFIGKEIEVKLSDDPVRRPVAFKLGSKEYAVAEVLANWQEQGFGSVNPRARDWKAQHLRNYYRIRTSEGEVFEVYGDWMASRRQRRNRPEKGRWYAYRRITGPAAPSEEAALGEPPSEV